MDTRPTANSIMQEDGAIVFTKQAKSLEDIQRQLANIEQLLKRLQKNNE
jgi:hypothetical protein